MKKLFATVFAIAGMLSLTSLACAADATAAAEAVKPGLDSFSVAITYLAAAIGMGIAAAGCGIGQGLGLKAACDGTARNPEASSRIMVTLILGLAFIESLAIYALVINLILLIANPLA